MGPQVEQRSIIPQKPVYADALISYLGKKWIVRNVYASVWGGWTIQAANILKM